MRTIMKPTRSSWMVYPNSLNGDLFSPILITFYTLFLWHKLHCILRLFFKNDLSICEWDEKPTNSTKLLLIYGIFEFQ